MISRKYVSPYLFSKYISLYFSPFSLSFAPQQSADDSVHGEHGGLIRKFLPTGKTLIFSLFYFLFLNCLLLLFYCFLSFFLLFVVAIFLNLFFNLFSCFFYPSFDHFLNLFSPFSALCATPTIHRSGYVWCDQITGSGCNRVHPAVRHC